MNPAIILAALDAALKLLDFITKARAEAARTGEWTPAQDAEVDAKLMAAFASPHWLTRPK